MDQPEPEDVDMTSSTVLQTQNHERQDAAMDMDHQQPEQTLVTPAAQAEIATSEIVEVEDMDTTPDSTPNEVAVEQSQAETVSPASPRPVEPHGTQTSEAPLDNINTQTEEIVEGNGEVTTPANPPLNADPAVVTEQSTPGSPVRAGTSGEDRDDDDSSEEDEHGQGWHEIIEDTSAPDEQELKEIEEVPEHSALERECSPFICGIKTA